MAWWYNNSGLNLLKGVEGDDTNPIRLTSAEILDFLRRIPQARASFNEIVPTMLEKEQERLRALAGGATKFFIADYKSVEDLFQANQNKAGVQTCGKRGGTRCGGNN